ncbi:type VII secretion protein EccB [Gordonia sp. NPDC003376]
MARQLTTRAQVNGYRFLLRRLEHALVRRDVRMLHDPMRGQARGLMIGAVLALLVVAGCGIWGLVRPQGSVGDSTILVGKGSGGLYLLLDGTLHPAMNLASARLVTGSAAQPDSVSDSKLAKYPRGPLLGIPGAPGALPGSAHPGESVWTVCDRSGGESATAPVELTVIGERPETGEGVATADPDDAVLVTDGAATFLVYTVMRGDHRVPVRAAVDTDDVAVMRALGLEDHDARAISRGLLNTFPEVDPLAVPVIDRVGTPSALPVPGVRVGSVIRTVGIDDATTFFVVLPGGVQQVGEVAAEMLRLAGRDDAERVVTVAPADLTSVPHTQALPVGEFPLRPPHLVGGEESSSVCSVWSRPASDRPAETALLVGTGLPLASGARPVRVSGADGAGPGIDQVYLRPGSGEYLQVTGDEADSPRTESLFYLSDSGVRFGIPDTGTAQVLGLGDSPHAAPWSVVSLLVAGPTLSRHAALVSHDGVGADPDGQMIAPPDE